MRYNRRRASATDLATDLRALLRELGIGAPYLLVEHSWGGVIARAWSRP